MLYHSFFVFIIGWAIWFAIDKHPVSLGTIVPGDLGDILDNFQLAFNMLKAGYLKASYVFIWKAHYLVLSLIGGLTTSMIFQTALTRMRRRKLRQVMWPKDISPDKKDSDQSTQN